MTRRNRNLWIAAALVLTTGLATYVFYLVERSHQRIISGAALEEMPLVAPDQPADAETAPVPIFVWRPDPENPGAAKLEIQTREIPTSGRPTETAFQIAAAVIQASQEVLPPQARVLQVYLLDDGTAVVDLSRAVAERLAGGVSAEYGIVTSIARSLMQNIREIKRVRFLVEGEERPTLSGHVSLRQSFM